MNKIVRIVVPCFAGCLAILICWHFYIISQPYVEDAVFEISVFDFFLWPLYLMGLTVAIIFQLFVTIPVLKKYKQTKKIIGLKLWPLIFLSCFLVGLYYCLINSSSALPFTFLLKRAVAISLFCIAYWAVNLFTLKLLDIKFAATE